MVGTVQIVAARQLRLPQPPPPPYTSVRQVRTVALVDPVVAVAPALLVQLALTQPELTIQSDFGKFLSETVRGLLWHETSAAFVDLSPQDRREVVAVRVET